LEFGRQKFDDWANSAMESCAQGGSHDGVLWVEQICRITGINYTTNLFGTRIAIAKLKGESEQKAYDAAHLRMLHDSTIPMPEIELLQQGLPEYLAEIIRMNQQNVSHALLKREYEKKREKLREDLQLERGDEDLLSFADAVSQARKPRRVVAATT
jgi:hypothetical protein